MLCGVTSKDGITWKQLHYPPVKTILHLQIQVATFNYKMNSKAMNNQPAYGDMDDCFNQ